MEGWNQGWWDLELSDEGAESYNKGAKIRLARYYDCQGCVDGWCVGASHPPQYCQICKKFGQKSEMLQESWPQFFPGSFCSFSKDSW